MNKGLRGVHKEDPFKDITLISDKEFLLTICQLNKTGLVMFEYLIRNGYIYKGMFLISYKDFMTEMKLRSKKSYYNGIDNLLKWDVLAKSENVSFFYFNPKFFSWL